MKYLVIGLLSLIFIGWTISYIPTVYGWSCLVEERTEKIEVSRRCMIFSSKEYFKLNHFCDCHEDWTEMSSLVKNSEQSRLRDQRFFPAIYWGSKEMPCGNNTFNVPSDLDDWKVCLYTYQDTTKYIYDGALTEIKFGSDVMFSAKKKFNDVGELNRQVVLTTSGVQVNYLLDYDKVGMKSLRKFRDSVRFDSIYFQKNDVADYRLIDRERNKCLASIRYEDYGKRFYFDVY